MKRIVLVYLILLPVMWFLTEGVWGGLHGIIGGLQISKSLQNPETSKEISDFMKQHGLSEASSKEQASSWFDNLPETDKSEFQELIAKSSKIDTIAGFGSTFAVSVIVFGIIGLLSGIFTRTWYYVGLLPIISFIINNPFVRFSVIQNMPLGKKIIIAVVAQFYACYLFAYAGTMIANRAARKKDEANLNG